eukprot:scaffold1189_cov315-Prasinococcus_capsulatus_cf.AAC.1
MGFWVYLRVRVSCPGARGLQSCRDIPWESRCLTGPRVRAPNPVIPRRGGRPRRGVPDTGPGPASRPLLGPKWRPERRFSVLGGASIARLTRARR